MFKPESTIPEQQEDQLPDVANDCSLKTTFKTTTLPMFWMKIKPKHAELAKNFSTISNVLFMRGWIFCDDSNKDKTTKKTERVGQTAGVIDLHKS